MLEKFWSLISLNLLPTLPVAPRFWSIFALMAFCFLPSYIAYAKQSVRRRSIYRFCVFLALLFYVCVFVKIEDFYFDRGTITVFAKTLYALTFAFAAFDARDGRAGAAKKPFFKEFVSHPLESFSAHFLYYIFKLLPMKTASNLGASCGRFAGVLSRRYSRLADENIKIAFPKKTPEARAEMAKAMWEMLGRYCAEPSHFSDFYRESEKYLTFVNDKILDRLKGRPFVAFISHAGSVGLISIPFAKHGATCSIIYKYPSNNLTANLATRSFGRGIGRLKFIPNNAHGTKEAIGVLKSGGAILATPDQKFLTGAPTKFFGRKVLSPIGVAKLAGHFHCPLLPIQISREEGLKHRIIFHEPFMPYYDQNGEADDIRTMQRVNDTIEKWVRENPEQWFWVHDRFGIKESLK
ncbi:MAG: hypothetical protein LBL52_00420 [Rickettsiales bacterium]|jgi:KDO2-lipid IV(A) lauroyltransferase|nr:hypothetical protein [Rickettsiales bacterium]